MILLGRVFNHLRSQTKLQLILQHTQSLFFENSNFSYCLLCAFAEFSWLACFKTSWLDMLRYNIICYNVLYIKRQMYLILLNQGNKDKELEEKMAVLEQQYQGKISFFSNFNPGWWSMQTNAIVSGRRKRWKQQRLFLIFLSATLAVFGQLLSPPTPFCLHCLRTH